MRKYIILILVIIKYCSQTLLSQGISETEAYLIANKVYQSLNFNTPASSSKSKQKSLKQVPLSQIKFDNVTGFYAFNYSDSGFVIISKYNRQNPVLAFSSNEKLNNRDIPPALKIWITAVEKSINNNTSTAQKENPTQELKLGENNSTIGERKPLLKTRWGQGLYYNDFCPNDINSMYPNNHVPVGCVATAMGQIMKYWEYPKKGMGANSYNHQKYGNIETTFSESNYQWDLMTDKSFYKSSPIAKLLSDCGIAINTNYTATQSYAGTADATQSLKNNFGYKNTAKCISKQNYSTDAWNCKIRNELDQGRPVLMQGSTNDEKYSHAFVCDGYKGDYFHFNWGWEGAFDGYYIIDADLIESIIFSFNLFATIGIEPADSFCNVSTKSIILNSQSSRSSTFKINTNTNWEIQVDKPWIKVHNLAGRGSTEINLWLDSLSTMDFIGKANISIKAGNNILKTVEVIQTSTPIYTPTLFSDIDSIHNSFQVRTNKEKYDEIFEGDSIFIDFTIRKQPWISLSYWILVNDSLVNNTYINENADSLYYVKKQYVGSFLEGEKQISVLLDPFSTNSKNVISRNIVIENKSSIIDVNEKLFVISGEPGKINLQIIASGEWEINSKETWIQPDFYRGINNSSLNINIIANTTGFYRESSLILSNNKNQIEIKIQQEAAIAAHNNLIEKYVKIFPNPSSDFIKIESINKIHSLCITDINGSIIFNTDNYNGTSIDVRSYPTGKYILSINDGAKTLKRKFIKY